MKKIISLLTVIALMAVLATAAFAAEEVALVVDTVEGEAGTEVTVNISIVNNPGFTSGQFDLVYDKDVLELTALELVGVEGWLWKESETKVKLGRVIMYADVENEDGELLEGYKLNGDCVLAVATFKINETAAAGTYEVKADVETLGDDEVEFLNYEAEFTGAVVVASGACTHPNLQHVEAVAPKCFEDGNKEYWHCPDCQMVWEDEALTIVSNMKNVIIAAAHTDVIHVEAVAPKCDADGNIEYWYCGDCGTVCLDADMTIISNMKNVVIPAAHTDLQHVDAVAPTCCENGNVEYWFCGDCGMVYLDADLTKVSNMKNVVDPATGEHDLSYVDVPTDDVNHKIVCKNSGKELGIEEHTYGEVDAETKNQTCTKCGHIYMPGTGDNTMIAVALATVAMMGIAVVVSKKKEF